MEKEELNLPTESEHDCRRYCAICQKETIGTLLREMGRRASKPATEKKNLQWQNLKVLRCPVSGDKLSESAGADWSTYFCPGECDFRVSEPSLMTMLADRSHPVNRFPVSGKWAEEEKATRMKLRK